MKKTFFRTGGTESPVLFVLSAAILSFVLHFAFAGNLEFHRDELLYFSQGMHPDWGYNSVPPLTGWIAALAGKTLGLSVYAVRFVPALLSFFMIILAAAIAGELGGKRYSRILAVTGLMVSIYFLRSFALFHPVHIEIFLWTLAIWMLLKYINTNSDNFLLLFGLTAGVTLLNKYLGILLFLSLLVTVPFTKYRSVFGKKKFLAGLAAGALVFLPNLIWQVAMDFPAFGHIGALYDTQLVHMNIGVFLTEQLLMPFTASVLTIAGLVWLLAGRDAKKYRFLGVTSLLVIVLLLLLKGKGYYTLGVFPFLTAAGAVAIEKITVRKWIRILLPVTMATVTVPFLPMGIPVLGREALKEYFRFQSETAGVDLGRRFEDGTIHSLPQDYADMIGWEEMTKLADSAWKKIEDKSSAIIYAENYGQAGAITVIGKKYGLPEALCFSESFLYWIPRDFEKEIQSAVYINDEMGDDVKSLFEDIELIGSVSDRDAREYGTSVWLCTKPRTGFNALWKERLKELDAY